jgi:hypothetical protein
MKATKPRHVGAGIVLAVLVAFLCLAIAFMYVGWGPGEGEPGQQMSTAGYVAMALGIIATLGLGTGLMALVFTAIAKVTIGTQTWSETNEGQRLCVALLPSAASHRVTGGRPPIWRRGLPLSGKWHE